MKIIVTLFEIKFGGSDTSCNDLLTDFGEYMFFKKILRIEFYI